MSYFPSVAFLTGSVGTGEWIVLFVVILIVVGPRRMPEIARKIGRMMEMFRRAADEFKDQLMTMDQETSTTHPAEVAAPKPADADGVASSGASDSSSPASYDDAYANMSDYPGNEDQVENWSSESQAMGSGDAESPAAAPASAASETASTAPSEAAPAASEPKKPSEEGA